MPSMEPYRLIAALVERSGRPVADIAREMDKATFQGTLHRYLNGKSPQPSRYTAKRIADFFRLPIEVIYDPEVAGYYAEELGIDLNTKVPEAVPGSRRVKPKAGGFFGQVDEVLNGGEFKVKEPAKPYEPPPAPQNLRALFPPEMLASIARLSAPQLAALHTVVGSFLSVADVAYQTTKRHRA